jgi:hypothetical protein
MDCLLTTGDCFLTLPTETKNRKVMQVGRKGVLLAQFLRDGREQFSRYLGHFAALVTNEVMMVGIAMDYIRDAANPKISRIDETSLDEQIERTIYCRFVEMRVPLANARDDFVGSDVSIALTDDPQDHFALRCPPVPVLAQTL